MSEGKNDDKNAVAQSDALNEMPLDPFEAFEIWMRANGFADVADCKPEDVDLQRLHKAIEIYGSEAA